VGTASLASEHRIADNGRMSERPPVWREELEAIVAARQELGPEYERQIVDSLADRLEREVDRRVAERPTARPHRTATPMVLGSLGLAIPLLGVAGATGGLAGVIVVALAIVLVNLIALRR
jgi:hypothetical protein